ncbi:unnamed protein product [Lota lota]
MSRTVLKSGRGHQARERQESELQQSRGVSRCGSVGQTAAETAGSVTRKDIRGRGHGSATRRERRHHIPSPLPPPPPPLTLLLVVRSCVVKPGELNTEPEAHEASL